MTAARVGDRVTIVRHYGGADRHVGRVGQIVSMQRVKPSGGIGIGATDRLLYTVRMDNAGIEQWWSGELALHGGVGMTAARRCQDTLIAAERARTDALKRHVRTFMRDNRHKPLQEYHMVMTDTFAGEKNYCWVERVTVKARSVRGALNAARKYWFLPGTRGRYDEHMGEWAPFGACIAVYIDGEF